MMTVLSITPDELNEAGLSKCLTKQFARLEDGSWSVTTYDDAYRFNAAEFEVEDFDDLVTLLTALEDCPDSCLIRGKLIPGKSPFRVRRKKNDPDPRNVFFEENPNGVQWIMLDFDGLEAPNEVMTDEERLEFLISHLPVEFHNSSYFYQWSSSAGLYGWKTPKAHLWFWLDEPWLDKYIKGKAVDEQWPVDCAVFDPIQINYTSRPIFLNCADPLPKRSGVVRKATDEVALGAWVRPVTAPAPLYRGPRLSPSDAFQKRLDEIGHPSLNDATLAAIACYVRLHGRDFDREDLKAIIRKFIWMSPRNDADKHRAASDRKLNEQINSAIRKYA